MTRALPALLWAHRFWLLGGYFALIFAESLWRTFTGRAPISPRLLTLNVVSWMVELGLRLATFGARLALFGAVASRIPWRLETTWPFAVGLFVAVDFIYYWKHRLLHTTRLGWALHAVHHSSDELHLLAAIRLGWIQRVLDDFFFLPLLLLGPSPWLLFALVDLNEGQQFWCHTQAIGRLGWLDGILNTPANHRVHHAADRALANANYGATFMLWDRLFGTWRTGDPRTFGLAEGGASMNLIAIQFGPLWRWLRAR